MTILQIIGIIVGVYALGIWVTLFFIAVTSNQPKMDDWDGMVAVFWPIALFMRLLCYIEDSVYFLKNKYPSTYAKVTKVKKVVMGLLTIPFRPYQIGKWVVQQRKEMLTKKRGN